MGHGAGSPAAPEPGQLLGQIACTAADGRITVRRPRAAATATSLLRALAAMLDASV
jgi:hypothetical protein